MPRVKSFDEQVVLEKAMTLFWKKGFYATSIQDLVNELGINRASLYDTFGGKKELFDRSFQHYRSTNIQQIKDFFKKEKEVKQGLFILFKRAIQQSKDDPDRKGCFVINTATELIRTDPFINQQIEENSTVFQQLFQDYLNYGVEQGQLSSHLDTQAVAVLLYTFYNGIKVITKNNFDESELNRSLNILFNLIN